MTNFNSISELQQWMNTKHGQNAILDENHIIQVLTNAGQELQRLMIEELNAYFNSYDPTYPEYRRGWTIASIRIGKPHKISINQWELEIDFDSSIANHPSVYGQEDGYTPWLLNAGWRNKLDATLDKDHFTRFKGTNFVSKAVNKFNENNKYGLKVEVFHNGDNITGRIYSYGR
jgi:hypothetical protein